MGRFKITTVIFSKNTFYFFYRKSRMGVSKLTQLIKFYFFKIYVLCSREALHKDFNEILKQIIVN